VHDPYLGLHMGEFFEAGSWSILGYMLMNCKDLAEAAEKSGRYAPIIGNLIEAKVQFRFNKFKAIYFTPPHAPSMSRALFRGNFSPAACALMRTLTGVKLSPLEVTFIYPELNQSPSMNASSAARCGLGKRIIL